MSRCGKRKRTRKCTGNLRSAWNSWLRATNNSQKLAEKPKIVSHVMAAGNEKTHGNPTGNYYGNLKCFGAGNENERRNALDTVKVA